MLRISWSEYIGKQAILKNGNKKDADTDQEKDIRGFSDT